MDDPTKDLIPRSAVEYICRKETVSTNPDDFAHSERFISYLNNDAISSFGRWQWANGFNTALVAVKCGLDKIPTIESERKTGRWLPDNRPGGGFWICSCCKFPSEAFAADKLYKYCPVCGADMRGGEQK